MLLCVLLLIGYLVPELRSIRHGSIFLVSLIALRNGEIRLKNPKFLLGFTSIMFYGLAISVSQQSLLSFKFFLLLLSPFLAALIFFSSLSQLIPKFLRLFYYASVIFQVAAIAKLGRGITGLGIFQLIGANETSNLLLSTSSEIENSFGFIFGYLGLYFMMRKEYRHFAVCLFLFILNYKRIVLLGFILAAGYYLLVTLRGLKNVPLRSLIYAAPFILVLLLIEIGSGDLNQWALDVTGRTMNHLTTGRYAIHHELYQNFFEFPRLFFGYGIGHAHSAVRTFEFTRMTLVHSDYLMIMYDFGLIGFILLFSLLLRNLLTSSASAVYLIFFLVMLIFDNTIIYFDVMFLLYLLLLDETKKPALVLGR